MTTIRLAIIDNHQMVRECLGAFLSKESDVEVVGEAGGAQEACALVKRVQPEVVLFEPLLSGRSILPLVLNVMRPVNRLHIIFVTSHLPESLVAEALQLGVAGFVSKRQPIAELLQAIRTVHSGQAYLPPFLSKQLLRGYMRRRDDHAAPPAALAVLSRREREVFGLLLHGLANKDIAAQLDISTRTVESHRAHVMKKLKVHSIPELFHFAAQHGLLSEESSFYAVNGDRSPILSQPGTTSNEFSV